MTTIGKLTHEFLNKFRIYGILLSCPSHNFSHLRAHAIGRSVTEARSSVVQASSSRRQERRWAIVCGSPAHPCAQSVKGSPTEPVLSRSSRQRLGHLQCHFDGGWHVCHCQAVFLEPQSAAACRRVEGPDCAHEALPRFQSASRWLVMKQLVYGVCRLSCAFHAAGNRHPDVRRSYTGQYVYAVQVRWFEAARDDSAAGTGQAYSAAEYQMAKQLGLSVVALHPHFELASLRMILFLAFTFILSSRCAFYSTEFGQGGCPDTVVLLCLRA